MSSSKSLSAIGIHNQLGLGFGQQQDGVNIREPSTALLCISSVDRYALNPVTQIAPNKTNPAQTNTLQSPYDFSINSSAPLLSGFFTRLALNEIQFRWTLPTMTSRNNKIYITAAGVDYLITIPEGWYSLENAGALVNLASAFQTQVVAAAIPNVSVGFTCVYNPIAAAGTNVQPNNCFVATSGGVGTFYFKRYNDPTRPSAVGLFEMMTWGTNQIAATSQRGSPNATLLSTPFVDIVCNNLTYNQSLKDADTGISRNVLCRLFLTPDAFTGNVANLGSAPILTHRCFPFPKQVKWNADQPIGNLQIQVYDSQGYLLTTGDGLTGTSATSYYDADMGDFSFSMLVSEV